jgi:hypothetical protein
MVANIRHRWSWLAISSRAASALISGSPVKVESWAWVGRRNVASCCWAPARSSGAETSETGCKRLELAPGVRGVARSPVSLVAYYTRFAVTPAALEDWHRYGLPGFLERLRDRLGDGCQPGKHQPRPRNERDQTHASPPVRRGRHQRYSDDVDRAVDRAVDLAAVTGPGTDGLHERW